MSRSRKIGIVWLALILVAGFGLHEARTLVDLRAQEEAARQEETAAAAELAAFQRTRATLRRELTAAERQLAQLPPASAPQPAVNSAHTTEVQAWMARIKRLRRIFAERPDQAIPELALLPDKEWLLPSKEVDFDSEDSVRQALSAVRNVAKRQFGLGSLSTAFRQYLAASGNRPPASIADLLPYFPKPPDPAVLARYEVASNQRPRPDGTVAVEVSLRDKTAVDALFDTRLEIRSGGYSEMAPPYAWVSDYGARMERARKAFTATHPNEIARNIAHLAPYFDPPLAPEVVERISAIERGSLSAGGRTIPP